MAAKTALESCQAIDECKEWADKAAALASYARQAEDDELEKMAVRIRSRAMRRAGELAKQIMQPHGSNQHGPRGDDATGISMPKAKVQEVSGFSERQLNTALRIANIPREDFERQVESSNRRRAEIVEVVVETKWRAPTLWFLVKLLLKQIEPLRGGDRKSEEYQTDGAVSLISRKAAAEAAGMSERQQFTAVRMRSRAMRRAGELLKQIAPGKTGPKSELGGGAPTQLTRRSAVENYGRCRP